MNPLHRKMFRQPGMSRQPAGILASSPELSNVVRQRMGQPVQMANGGQNVTDYMSAIRDLAAKGDKATLNNIATDQRLPRSVQMAAANALAGRSGVPDQIQAAPVSDADRMAANRANLGALRGRVSQDALTDQAMSAIAAGGSPRDGIEAIDPRITDSVAALTALRGKTRADALSDEAMAQMRPDPSATTNPNILPAMPDESSGLGVMGEDPTGLPFGLELPFITGEAAKPKNKQPTDTELAAAQAEGMSRRGDFPDRPSGDLSKVTTDTATDTATAETNEPAAEDAATALVTDPSTLFPQINEVLDGEGSNKQKADAVDEALNIKGTRKERTEQRYEMLKDLLGEDKAKDIRTDVGYNLMMTGLMIAAGQSGDAMTNIATGLAKGLAGYGTAAGEAAQAATKEEKALKLMAAKEVGDEMTAETAAKIRAGELKDSEQLQRDIAADKIQAQKDIAAMPGDTQRLIETMAKGSGKTPLEIYLQTKAGTSTDTDDLTISLARRYPALTTDEARILASNLKGSTSEFGTLEAAIKAQFGIDVSKQGQSQSQTTSGGFKLKQ